MFESKELNLSDFYSSFIFGQVKELSSHKTETFSRKHNLYIHTSVFSGLPGVGKGRSELGIGTYQTNNKLQEVSSFRKSLLNDCISQVGFVYYLTVPCFRPGNVMEIGIYLFYLLKTVFVVKIFHLN